MLICCDIDGTANAAPEQMLGLLSALKSAGNHITILTGVSDSVVTQQDFDQKSDYLSALGLSAVWDDMCVFANPAGTDLADMKAQYAKSHDCAVLIDNAKANARAASAAGIPLCLVPWATRV